MDFRQPLSSVIPGATGRILNVLGRTLAELNLSTVADLAEVSVAQTSRVLARLHEIGLVTRREVPPSSLFSLNRRHVAAPFVEALLRSPEAVIDRMREAASAIAPPPVNMTLFGSAARRAATPTSDIDVLVIRPKAADLDEDRWTSTLHEWSGVVTDATGNRVNIMQIDEPDARKLLRARRAPWKDILEEGVTLAGRSAEDLIRA